MSAARKLARAQAKLAQGRGSANPFQELLGGLSDLQESLPKTQQLDTVLGETSRLLTELEASREALVVATLELGDAAYELRKQRAVFLRFLFAPDPIISNGPTGLAQFLECEERYRAEFDLLSALAQLSKDVS
jgi:hypothetical protein